MNRKSDRDSLDALMKKLRDEIPDITLRTTLITGFPGETEEQFSELCEFVKATEFDRLGCFAYSEEEGTIAATFTDQIDQQTRVDRSEIVMNDQSGIVLTKNALKVGTVAEVIIEGYDDYIKCYFGRTRADAPEIDGKIFFISPKPLELGTFCKVRINDSLEYDLLGELEEEE
jgi:ribosomal protein S12 methylthiotransferase